MSNLDVPLLHLLSDHGLLTDAHSRDAALYSEDVVHRASSKSFN